MYGNVTDGHTHIFIFTVGLYNKLICVMKLLMDMDINENGHCQMVNYANTLHTLNVLHTYNEKTTIALAHKFCMLCNLR